MASLIPSVVGSLVTRFYWESPSYGISSLELLGTLFHVEAFEVADPYADVLTCTDDAQDAKLQAVQDAFSDDGFQTVVINDRHYVLIITPHDR